MDMSEGMMAKTKKASHFRDATTMLAPGELEQQNVCSIAASKIIDVNTM